MFIFFGGLWHEIQDIVFHIEFYTLKRLFQLAMLAEKELQKCQQKNHTNTGDNLNQILARVEEPFAKVETAIKRRVVTSATTTTSSPPPPPPTHTLESGKTLNHAENAQTNRDRAANERKELDVKSENKHVSELKGSFMLAIKSVMILLKLVMMC